MMLMQGTHESAADDAGCFRRKAFTKPANDKGKANTNQEKPALRLPAGRKAQVIKMNENQNE